jgi:hypothetical protein
MHRLLAIVALGLLVSACSPESEVSLDTTTTTVGHTTTSCPPSNELCIAGDLPFGDEGLIAALGEDTGDASSVTEIRWDPSATCERLTINFGAGSGAPAATLGPTGVSVIPYAGVVRILLPPEVSTTAIADNLFEGDILHAVYVVRDNGQLAIDVHAVDGVPITARAFTTTSPASLVVDIQGASTDAIPIGVTAASTVVMVSPTPGTDSYPILVEGYVSPGTSEVHLVLIHDDIFQIGETQILNGETDAWQAFSSMIDDGPVGSIVVFAGSVGDDDQPDEGARVSVTVE